MVDKLYVIRYTVLFLIVFFSFIIVYNFFYKSLISDYTTANSIASTAVVKQTSVVNKPKTGERFYYNTGVVGMYLTESLFLYYDTIAKRCYVAVNLSSLLAEDVTVCYAHDLR